MFSITRLFGARSKLERLWAETQVDPPETVLLYEESHRADLAESEWFTDTLNSPFAPKS
jgi:hypothetical protein